MEKCYKKLSLITVAFFACLPVHAEIDERAIEHIALFTLGALVGCVGTGIYFSQEHARKTDGLKAENAAKDIVIAAQQRKINNLEQAHEETFAPQVAIKRSRRLQIDEHERDAQSTCSFFGSWIKFLCRDTSPEIKKDFEQHFKTCPL